MIPKKLDEIDEVALQSLIVNAVQETKTLDYKRELPGTNDEARREFLADVSSFANTAGGDLIYGIEEDKGLPIKLCGISSGDLEKEILRLEQILASGLEPRVKAQIRSILCSVGPVLIVRCERSWSGPHRVRQSNKFQARNSSGKYDLDVSQLRDAFTFSSTITDRVRAFRTDRVISLANNDTPLPFFTGAKIVLHFLPLESFISPVEYDYLKFHKEPWKVPPIGGLQGVDRRINFEGLMTYRGTNTEAHSYLQIYRNGILEAVDGHILAPFGNQSTGQIPSVVYEGQLLDYFPMCLSTLQQLGVEPPILFGLTFTNIRGYRMELSNHSFPPRGDAPISRDSLMLPEALISKPTVPPEEILLPLFNLIWNACGHPKSRNFNDHGEWIHGRR